MFKYVKGIFKKKQRQAIKKITPFMGEYLSAVGHLRKFRDGFTPMEKEKKRKLFFQDIDESVQKEIRREEKLKKKQ